jgi:hypothetical protein
MTRDPKDKKAIDQSSDTYDTIEWLLKNVANNNGRVGVAGRSYGLRHVDDESRCF